VYAYDDDGKVDELTAANADIARNVQLVSKKATQPGKHGIQRRPYDRSRAAHAQHSRSVARSPVLEAQNGVMRTAATLARSASPYRSGLASIFQMAMSFSS
jgi:hypothetical protein